MPDVVLPSLRQPLPKVAMVLDTSGSMSDHMLGQALAEVGGVLRGLGIGRRHLRDGLLRRKGLRRAEGHGREGGTVARRRRDRHGRGARPRRPRSSPRPDLVIVLTDGHTPWPSKPRRPVYE